MLILQWFPVSQFSLVKPLLVKENSYHCHLFSTSTNPSMYHLHLRIVKCIVQSNIGKINHVHHGSFSFLVVWQMFISAPPNVHFVYNKYKVLLVASVQSNILRSVSIPIEISGQGYNVIFLWTWHYGEDLKSIIYWSRIDLSQNECIQSVTFQTFHQLTKLKSATIKRLIGLWKFLHQNEDWICRWWHDPFATKPLDCFTSQSLICSLALGCKKRVLLDNMLTILTMLTMLIMLTMSTRCNWETEVITMMFTIR